MTLQDERTTLDKEELNKKHAYEMVMQKLQDSVRVWLQSLQAASDSRRIESIRMPADV